ncbi:MAG: hypothetical protein QXJ48_04515 [Candidatus Korarchaeum sp.]
MSAELMDEVEGYLSEMGVKYQRGEGYFASLWRIGEGSYMVAVLVSDDWITITTSILDKEKLRDEVEFYKALLNTHYSLAEVRYHLDDEGNLGASTTIPASGLNKELFSSRFDSVLFAIDYFLGSIAPKFGIEVE